MSSLHETKLALCVIGIMTKFQDLIHVASIYWPKVGAALDSIHEDRPLTTPNGPFLFECGVYRAVFLPRRDGEATYTYT